jgi:hypothetical protein
MIYYRIASQTAQSATWQWRSTVLTSIEAVLGLLKMYRCIPKEHIRVFLSSSTEEMDEMLKRENQGLLSTAVTVDQLWDKHSMSGLEMRRLELELGSGGDYDSAYTFSLPISGPQVLAWTKLLAKVVRGELEP